MRDSVIFYRSFYEAIKELPCEVQVQVYSAIFEYSLNFSETVLEGLPKAIFTLIKPQLDANNKRYENGTKGGKRKQTGTETEPKANQTRTEAEPNKNVNVNVNDNQNQNILLEKETKGNKPDSELFSTDKLPGAGERKKVAQKKETPPLQIPPEFEPIWNEWTEYRKDRKFKPYAGAKWEQKALDKLLELSDRDPTTARQILDTTYQNNYQGFFPLKNNSKSNGSANNTRINGRSAINPDTLTPEFT